MQKYPALFYDMFVNEQRPLQAKDLCSLFYENFSPQGNNRRAKENQTICHWRDWLINVEAMASQHIELAAIGRPLFPGMLYGMLYDCHKDSFIPGVTLWGKKSLSENLDIRLQLLTDLKFSSSDSLSSKSRLLDVSASLKVSFLGGLVEVGGSAKYLRDTKSSNQQSRVTMHYSETTRFEQLTMTQLGQITYPQTISEDKCKAEIERELNVMAKKIPGFSFEGKAALQMTDEEKKTAEKIACTFHGDVHLQQNPTTYMEALELYKKLPTLLKENPQNVVPIKVWLYPLHLLDSKTAQLKRDVSTSALSNTVAIMERLDEATDVEQLYSAALCIYSLYFSSYFLSQNYLRMWVEREKPLTYPYPSSVVVVTLQKEKRIPKTTERRE
ncbi:hypothetical protein QQF64_035821 [Cirrhinus molitorella]|uniref:Uncharacterized protein n=1 Tax=Cirrhinus molitorella TaxID=172907 RepID=A0ABR3NGV0_9TELE